MPEKISCKVQNLKHYYDRSESLFYYPDFKIKINGAWLDAEEPFNSGYYVAFEKGVLKFKNDTVIFTDNFGKKEKESCVKHNRNGKAGHCFFLSANALPYLAPPLSKWQSYGM